MTPSVRFPVSVALRLSPLLAGVAALLPHLLEADDVPKVHRELLSSIGSERATSGNGNKIVTVDGKTHVVWQDANEKGYFARVRTLDHETGNWSPTYTLGEGRDNHARPTITADSRGYLHVIIGGHHSGLQYRRSVRSGNASEWSDVETFGKTTYPVLICGPDDTLYLAGRHDSGWAGMDLYAKRPGDKWKHRGLLVAKQERYEYYAAYHNALAWGPDHKSLHMSTGFFMGFREAVGIHQAVGYMRSDDFGQTWVKSDGTRIELPATTDTIDLIDEGIRDRGTTDKPKPGIQHCGIAVDSENRPFVVYVRHTPDAGQIFLVTPHGGGWEHRPLQDFIERHCPDLGAIGCHVSITGEDVLCLALTLVPLDHPQANWSPGIGGRPAYWTRDYPNIKWIIWLESHDGGWTFISREIIAHDPDRGTLLPTLERPTGFNGVAGGGRPSLLYFEGLSRYRKRDEIIQNDVYFVRLQ